MPQDEIARKLSGQVPLVIGLRLGGEIRHLVILARPQRFNVNLEGHEEPLPADGFLITREQAFRLTVDLTEIMGPLDPDPS